MTSNEMNSVKKGGEIPGIIILTHGRAGEELIRSAEMIIGKIEKAQAFSLMPGEDSADYAERVSEVLSQMPDGTLVMVDILGGTPSNCAAALSRKHQIAVVSGVNLAMLIEAVTLRESLAGEDLAERVIASARGSIKNIIKVLYDEVEK